MNSNKVKLVSVLLGVLALLFATIGVANTIGGIAFILFALSVMLIYYQENVLYIPVVMGYKTVEDNPEGYRSPSEWGASHREFFLTTPDGISIHGWHIHRPSPAATVIFCHENAGNIGLRVNNLVAMSAKLNVDVVAFDYRGYGQSTGRPTESGLMLDTETVYDYVRKELKADKVVLYGRSLGGAVALQFASLLGSRGDVHLRGVIAENTFTSIADMVGSVFPFLNFDLVKKYCLRLRWETDKFVEFIKGPVMLISGLKDEIVPASHMAELKRLCDKHKVMTHSVAFPDGKHNDTWVVGGEQYWDQQRAFIGQVVSKSS